MGTLDTMVTSLIGSAPLNYVIDTTGNYIKVYDTSYLIKGLMLILTLNFIYKLLLHIVRNIGRAEK